MRFLHDFLTCLIFFTRVPIILPSGMKLPPLARAVWAFAPVGMIIGLLAVIVAKGALALGLSVMVSALFALAAQIIVTGALHEDGLGDCADGFFGGDTPQRRLEIMKDSRIGSYGVLATGIFLLARLLLISALIEADRVELLIALAALSRVPLAVGLRLKNARPEGLSACAGKPSRQGVAMAVVMGGIALALALFWGEMSGGKNAPPQGLLFMGLWVLGMVATLCLCSLWVFWVSYRKIGGQTGDVLGALQQVGEVGLLIFVNILPL